MEKPKAFDLWTWNKCKDTVRSLSGRLGFPKGNTLRFLDLEVNLDNGTIMDTTKNKSFDPMTEYVFFILNQYAKAKEIPLSGKYITFRHISGGRVYDPVFEGRVVRPVAHHLGNDPEAFKKAAKALGGESVQLGDFAFSIPAFPLFPLTYVLWVADNEFPARVRVFLDNTAASYLDAEAITHLASLATQRLLVVAGKK